MVYVVVTEQHVVTGDNVRVRLVALWTARGESQDDRCLLVCFAVKKYQNTRDKTDHFLPALPWTGLERLDEWRITDGACMRARVRIRDMWHCPYQQYLHATNTGSTMVAETIISYVLSPLFALENKHRVRRILFILYNIENGVCLHRLVALQKQKLCLRNKLHLIAYVNSQRHLLITDCLFLCQHWLYINRFWVCRTPEMFICR